MVHKVFANKQFMVFILSCGIAALVNFGSRMVLGLWMPYVLSIIVAYILGIITAYILCRCFVFEAKKNNAWQQMFYFTLVNAIAIVLTVIVSVALFKWGLWFIHDTFAREEVAHFIGICVPAFSSYLGHKYFSFR